MLNVEKLFKKPRTFKMLTGLTPDKFSELLAKLEPLFKEAEDKRKKRSDRIRKRGGGRKQILSLTQSLFMLLLYYRAYINHEFLGVIIGMDGSNVCRYFRRTEPLLAKIFRIPERKINLTEEEILELIFDATEQESEKRKGSGYSGKKKKNTVKTQIVVTPEGKIKSVSKTVKGNMHDKKLYDKTRTVTLIKVKRKGDLAYLGTDCQIPIKKQKKKKLTAEEKARNKRFSQERIIVEHVFAHLKKFKILDNKFRNPVKNYNLIFKNIAGIRNFITE